MPGCRSREYRRLPSVLSPWYCGLKLRVGGFQGPEHNPVFLDDLKEFGVLFPCPGLDGVLARNVIAVIRSVERVKKTTKAVGDRQGPALGVVEYRNLIQSLDHVERPGVRVAWDRADGEENEIWNRLYGRLLRGTHQEHSVRDKVRAPQNLAKCLLENDHSIGRVKSVRGGRIFDDLFNTGCDVVNKRARHAQERGPEVRVRGHL